MKNLLLIISVIFVFSSCSLLKGNKEFKGKITYKMEYEGEDLTPSMTAQMPQTTEVLIMGNKTKTTTEMPFYSSIQIVNPDEDLFVQLLDAGEYGKYAIKKNLSEVMNDTTADDGWESSLQFTEQTKEIQGYETKKVVVTLSKEGEEDKIFDVYYATAIPDPEKNKGSIYEGIEGVLLEFRQVSGPVQVLFKASEVKETNVSELDFLTPEEFEEVTEEELREKLGG